MDNSKFYGGERQHQAPASICPGEIRDRVEGQRGLFIVHLGGSARWPKFCFEIVSGAAPRSRWIWPLLLARVRGSSIRSLFFRSNRPRADARGPTVLYSRPWRFFPPNGIRLIAGRPYENRFRRHGLQLFRDCGERIVSGPIQRVLPPAGAWLDQNGGELGNGAGICRPQQHFQGVLAVAERWPTGE